MPFNCGMRRHHLASIWMCCCVCVFIGTWPLAAQDSSDQDTPTTESTPSRPEYHVGPADVLSIQIAGLDQLGGSFSVSNSGKIHFPEVGIIRVNGMSTRELELEIATQLRDRQLVTDPWVSVSVQEYRSQPVYILGEVLLPGQFAIENELYLSELITLSGGFNAVASPIGYLYRRKPDANKLSPEEIPTDEAIAIDFAALNEGMAPELNLRLQGGDVLYVPERRAQNFYVIGEVGKAGQFDFGDGVSVINALAMAGGAGRSARIDRAVVARYSADGKYQEVPVNFKAIIDGREPDFPVQPNDIIFIPRSGPAKAFVETMVRTVPILLIRSLLFF